MGISKHTQAEANGRFTAPGPHQWTTIVGAALRTRIARRVRKLNDESYWERSTAWIQRAELRSLLEAAAETEIGRENGFGRLARLPENELVESYRKAIPVADWYVYQDQLRRMREEGQSDVLWPGLVRDFAQTSGTTAGDKYIPVSKAMLRSNYRASLDMFAYATRFGVSIPRLMAGRALFLGGSTALTENEHGVRTGDLSGIVTRLIRWPITSIYLPGKEVALMSDWPAKIDAMARLCLDQDIRMVSGMPSWGLVLFGRVIELAREQGRDVKTLQDVWPNLQLLVHGGVNYAPFEGRVRQIWSGDAQGSDIPHRVELYPASEGFVAIQDRAGDPGMRLNSDMGIFYEFIPLEEIDNPEPRAFTCEQVEKGQRYVVVMSTCAGLWRYILGDVVEFDTIPGGLDGTGGEGPCRLRIVGRHRHFINAFGENLIVEHIESAVAAAAGKMGLVVGEFTAAPVYPAAGQRAGLEIAVEMSAGGSADLERFGEAFDAALKRQNVDYTTKRSEGLGMGPPTVTALPQGTFHRWLASKGKLGGQHKCPRCANHRDLVEEIKLVGASGAESAATSGF